MNGGSQPLDDHEWSGKGKYEFEAEIPQNQLIDGENFLEIKLLRLYQDLYFDWFEVSFGRDFQAENDQLQFVYDNPGTWQFQVEGLTSPSVSILDITNPLTPTRIVTPTVTFAGGTYTAAFEREISSMNEYLVVGSSGELSPKTIEAYTPEEFLSTQGADYVFITHPDLITETQRLADYRAAQGLSTRVVDVEELYNQFNFGIYHPYRDQKFPGIYL